MEPILKPAFDALERWPLIQGAVAVVVLGFGTLIAWAALKAKPSPAPSSPPPQAPAQQVPVPMESWLAQQILETHYRVEQMKPALDALSAKAGEIEQVRGLLGALSSKIDGVMALLKRRQSRKSKN